MQRTERRNKYCYGNKHKPGIKHIQFVEHKPGIKHFQFVENLIKVKKNSNRCTYLASLPGRECLGRSE